jgi:hypothetical protein
MAYLVISSSGISALTRVRPTPTGSVPSTLLFRMLEARPLKRALAGSGAEVALIVSDDVYRSLVCRYPSLVSPDAFQRVKFQVKYTRAWAWTYLPGAPAQS